MSVQQIDGKWEFCIEMVIRKHIRLDPFKHDLKTIVPKEIEKVETALKEEHSMYRPEVIDVHCWRVEK